MNATESFQYLAGDLKAHGASSNANITTEGVTLYGIAPSFNPGEASFGAEYEAFTERARAFPSDIPTADFFRNNEAVLANFQNAGVERTYRRFDDPTWQYLDGCSNSAPERLLTGRW